MRDDLKWEMAKAIIRATEAAGLWDQPRFLEAIGMPGDWLKRAIEEPDTVPLEEYVRVYDQAAEQSGWKSTAEVIRTATEMQRFREWPQ